MATASLTTSPTQVDAGSSDNVSITNTGATDVVVARGAQSFTLRPTQARVVYPEGVAVTAATVSGSGSVSYTATAARLSQQAQFAADPAFTGTYAGIGPLVSGLSSPIYAAHKGSLAVAPEHTMSGYRYGLTYTPMIDLDARLLSDGSFGIMHDATTDRTCTTTGNVNDHSAQSWRQLTVNASGILGGAWANTEAPPLLRDVLREFAGKACFTIEVKDATTQACSAIINAVQAYGLTRSVIIQCATLSALAPAVAAGLPCQYVSDSFTPSTVLAAGVGTVVVSNGISNSVITSAIAAGLKVWVYGTNRRSERDAYLALGVTGFYTDDPAYLAAAAPLRTTDPFAKQVFFPGMALDLASRGSWIGSNRLGITSAGQHAWTLQGYLCPITATSYTLTFNLTFDTTGASSSAYAGIFLCHADDSAFKNNSGGVNYPGGYRAYMQANGSMKLDRLDSPTTVTNLGNIATNAGALFADGTTITMRITVSPTQVTLQRTDGTPSTVITATDSTYRGGYVHIGQVGNSGAMKTSFGSLSVV